MDNIIVQILLTILAAIISAGIGGFLGSLITIAKFGSKIELQAQSINQIEKARQQDRENDRRENERMREEFRSICADTNKAREKELEFIRREIGDFRSFINASDRRQRLILDLTVDIARKNGVTHRVTDLLERIREDESDNG